MSPVNRCQYHRQKWSFELEWFHSLTKGIKNKNLPFSVSEIFPYREIRNCGSIKTRSKMKWKLKKLLSSVVLFDNPILRNVSSPIEPIITQVSSTTIAYQIKFNAFKVDANIKLATQLRCFEGFDCYISEPNRWLMCVKRTRTTFINDERLVSQACRLDYRSCVA